MKYEYTEIIEQYFEGKLADATRIRFQEIILFLEERNLSGRIHSGPLTPRNAACQRHPFTKSPRLQKGIRIMKWKCLYL